MSESAPKHVIELGPQNCEAEIKRRKIVGVCIYAPWCGYCEMFLPTWEKIARKLKDMNFCRIDGAQHLEFCQQMFPEWESGYPTIHFYVDGKFHSAYESSREEGVMMKYCMDLLKNNL